MTKSGLSDAAPHYLGHRDRLRERAALGGIEALPDYELLELLLFRSVPYKDTKPLAKELIQRFGNIRGALDARPEELLEITGFGPGLVALWRVLGETRARYAAADVRQREVLATPEAVAHMAQARLGTSPHEECWLALVDRRNRLMAWERLRRGGIAEVAIYPRDVLEAALLRKASGIILVHNHPGGNPAPSQEDRLLTEELQRLAPRMGLRFLDHVIVTDGDCYSITQSQRI